MVEEAWTVLNYLDTLSFSDAEVFVQWAQGSDAGPKDTSAQGPGMSIDRPLESSRVFSVSTWVGK